MSSEFSIAELHPKMCKKIADLTRVVDKLFRQFYEGLSTINALQTKCKHLTKQQEQLNKERDDATSALTKSKEEVVEVKCANNQLREQIDVLKNNLLKSEIDKDDVLKQSMDLSQCLNTTKQQLEELRLMYKQLVESNQQMPSCSGHDELIESLKNQLHSRNVQFEEMVREKEAMQVNYEDLQRNHFMVVGERENLMEQLEVNKADMDSLQKEKCSLQLKITQLLKELQELRCSSSSHEKIKRAVPVSKKPAEPFLQHQRREYWLQHHPFTNAEKKDEEVEKLKQELQRYRLELMNRESNFNRVFTDKTTTPTHLKPYHRKFSSSGTSMDTDNGSPRIQLRLPRLQSTSSSINSFKPKR